MPSNSNIDFSIKQQTSIILSLVMILTMIALVGLRINFLGMNFQNNSPSSIWVTILILLVAFTIISGYGVTGRWRGILIDYRNKLSLSRLQLLCWTILILSAYFTAVLVNVSLDGSSPLNINIPSNLWVVMGISTGSTIGATVLLAQKRVVTNNDEKDNITNNALHTRENPNHAKWGDILKGDDNENSNVVDIGKLQMFMFSFILIFSYAAVIADQFSSGSVISSLPAVEEGMNVLLGISHTGYLSTKAVTPPTTQS